MLQKLHTEAAIPPYVRIFTGQLTGQDGLGNKAENAETRMVTGFLGIVRIGLIPADACRWHHPAERIPPSSY